MIAFFSQWALWGLFSLAGLVAIYLLRSPAKKQVVSSFLLWPETTSLKQGRSSISRLKTPFIFFLEFLIILLIVFGAAHPAVKSAKKKTPLVLILDDSISMRARDKGISFQKKGMNIVQKIINEGKFSPLRFVLAGKDPVIAGQKAKNPHIIFKNWKCLSQTSHIDKAIRFARKVWGKSANIMVISDHGPRDGFEKNDITWIATGAPILNAGFVNGAREPHGRWDSCFIEIKNFSATKNKIIVEFNSKERVFYMKPHETKKLTVRLPSDMPFTASLNKDDFDYDNKVILPSLPLKKAKAIMDISDKKIKNFVERAVRATGLTGGNHPGSKIIFTDSLHKKNNGSENLWEVVIINEKNAKAYKGPYVGDWTHPIMAGIRPEGIIWGTGEKIKIPGDPLLMVGNIPVITFENSLGIRRIFIRFNPAFSTLQRTPVWPALIWNIINYRISFSPGLKKSALRLGSYISFIPGTKNEEIYIKSPDLEIEKIKARAGRVIFMPKKPGEYIIETRDEKIPVGVNLFNPDESDFAGASSGKWGDMKKSSGFKMDFYPLYSILLFIAFLLLVVHLMKITPGLKPETKIKIF